jgi:hypothetical protein
VVHGPIHISPRQAVEAHRELQAMTSLGMHFGTFQLADDGLDDPPSEVKKALDDGVAGPNPRSSVLAFSEGRDVL